MTNRSPHEILVDELAACIRASQAAGHNVRESIVAALCALANMVIADGGDEAASAILRAMLQQITERLAARAGDRAAPANDPAPSQSPLGPDARALRDAALGELQRFVTEAREKDYALELIGVAMMRASFGFVGQALGGAVAVMALRDTLTEAEIKNAEAAKLADRAAAMLEPQGHA
jgi:hypothetical protein